MSVEKSKKEEILKNPFELVKHLNNNEIVNFEELKQNKKFQSQGLNVPILVKLYSLSSDRINQRFAIDILNNQRYGFYGSKECIYSLIKFLPNNETFKNEKIFFLKPVLSKTKYSPKFKSEEIYKKLEQSYPSMFKGKSYKEIDEIFVSMLFQKKYKLIIDILVKSLAVELNQIEKILLEFIKNLKGEIQNKKELQKLQKFIPKYIKEIYLKKYYNEIKNKLTKTGKLSQSQLKKEFEQELKELKRKQIENLF
jgi:hypothetical protein